MTRQFSLRLVLFLLCSDLALMVTALLLATGARMTLPFGKVAPPSVWTIPWPVYALGLIVWLVVFVTLDVYHPRVLTQPGLELLRALGAALFAWMILAGVLYFSFRDVSRLQYVYFLLICQALIVLHRLLVWQVLRRWGAGRPSAAGADRGYGGHRPRHCPRHRGAGMVGAGARRFRGRSRR